MNKCYSLANCVLYLFFMTEMHNHNIIRSLIFPLLLRVVIWTFIIGFPDTEIGVVAVASTLVIRGRVVTWK